MDGLLILNITSSLFVVLFLFLFFLFVTILLSLKNKPTKTSFEPSLTVLVPAYNEEKNIAATIDSILKNNYPKNKANIIVVDDGSTDDTVKIVRQFKNVSVLMQNHKGKTEALNLGVKESKTEIIVTIDADTILDKNCLKKLVAPMNQENLGATTGTSMVKTQNSIWQVYQNIEYNFNNVIRKAFTQTFSNGIWFFGALASYKKSALNKIGGFKKDTLTEDMDTALELYKAGYKTLHVYDALSKTEVPLTFKQLYNQRARWWIGVLQALKKNKLLNIKENITIIFLYLNQYWWTFYSFVSLPILIYQFIYWLPYNTASLYELLRYSFNWFSLSGPLYVLYMIPEWGLNFYNIFAIVSGLISAICIIIAQITFKDKFNYKSILAIIFYFPYTIVLNMMIVISVIANIGGKKKRYFKK